jgi:cysteine desulfurase / selenocysteine lyase
MTGNDPARSTPPEQGPALSRRQEPETSRPAEDPGYLTRTGEAAAEDGSVAPIIGGLPAVEGSAWDIGAPLDERGADLAGKQGSPPDRGRPGGHPQYVNRGAWRPGGSGAARPGGQGSPVNSSTTPAMGSSAGYADAFGGFDGRIWLNAAHQGPLPRLAAKAAEEAVAAKLVPHRISDEAFVDVPRRLRELLGRLIGASAEEIILGNSASWGLQVLANGLPWRHGDEVLVLADEFPATVFPWLVTERHGVTVRQLELGGPVLAPERLDQELSPQTRVVAVNWVRSLTGYVVDVAGLSEVCARAGVHLVLNVTQGLGALPFDVRRLPVAAMSCSGFKWLCGPYGTGFAWIRPDVLQTMQPVQAYWLALPDGAELDLNREGEHRLRDDLGARAYDIFGTGNFLNFIPWAAALEYLLTQGTETIADHDQALVEQLIGLLDHSGYRFVSPTDPGQRAAIVVISAADPRDNQAIYQRLTGAGIDTALRAGNIRLSPHLYNTPGQIQYAAAILADATTTPRTGNRRV